MTPPVTVRIDELVIDEHTPAAAVEAEVARVLNAKAPVLEGRRGKVAAEVARAVEGSTRP